MCVPGRPAGCGPSSSTAVMRSSSSPGSSTSAPLHRKVRPPWIRARTSSPSRKSAGRSPITTSGRGASGSVSMAVTSTARGSVVGSGTRPKGRARSAAQAPVATSCRRTSSGELRESRSASIVPKTTSSPTSPARSTTTECRARRRPRSTAATVPAPRSAQQELGMLPTAEQRLPGSDAVADLDELLEPEARVVVRQESHRGDLAAAVDGLFRAPPDVHVEPLREPDAPRGERKRRHGRTQPPDQDRCGALRPPSGRKGGAAGKSA